MRKILGQQLLSHKELAEKLSCHRATLHRWRSTELIPSAIYIGKSPRWRAEEIDDWIAAGAPPNRKWEWDGREK